MVRLENYDLSECMVVRPCLYLASNVAITVICRMALLFSCKYDSARIPKTVHSVRTHKSRLAIAMPKNCEFMYATAKIGRLKLHQRAMRVILSAGNFL